MMIVVRGCAIHLILAQMVKPDVWFMLIVCRDWIAILVEQMEFALMSTSAIGPHLFVAVMPPAQIQLVLTLALATQASTLLVCIRSILCFSVLY